MKGHGAHEPDDLAENLDAAVRFAERHVADGGLPFVGALVLRDGTVTPWGVNRVLQTGDPRAHAEIEAIRQAVADHGAEAVRGAVLLATGEPCALCYGYAADHGVAASFHAVGVERAAHWGFDYRGAELDEPGARLKRAARQLPVADAERPFVTHAAKRRS